MARHGEHLQDIVPTSLSLLGGERRKDAVPKEIPVAAHLNEISQVSSTRLFALPVITRVMRASVQECVPAQRRIFGLDERRGSAEPLPQPPLKIRVLHVSFQPERPNGVGAIST